MVREIVVDYNGCIQKTTIMTFWMINPPSLPVSDSQRNPLFWFFHGTETCSDCCWKCQTCLLIRHTCEFLIDCEQLITQNCNNGAIWGTCVVHSLTHFQFPIDVFFHCFGCRNFNWASRTFGITCAGPATTKFSKHFLPVKTDSAQSSYPHYTLSDFSCFLGCLVPMTVKHKLNNVIRSKFHSRQLTDGCELEQYFFMGYREEN